FLRLHQADSSGKYRPRNDTFRFFPEVRSVSSHFLSCAAAISRCALWGGLGVLCELGGLCVKSFSCFFLPNRKTRMVQTASPPGIQIAAARSSRRSLVRGLQSRAGSFRHLRTTSS